MWFLFSLCQYWTWSFKGTLTRVSHGLESFRGRSKQTMIITVSGDDYIGEKCLVNEKTATKKSSRNKDPIQCQNPITELDHVVSWVKSCDVIMFSYRQSNSKFTITPQLLCFQTFLWTVESPSIIICDGLNTAPLWNQPGLYFTWAVNRWVKVTSGLNRVHHQFAINRLNSVCGAEVRGFDYGQ